MKRLGCLSSLLFIFFSSSAFALSVSVEHIFKQNSRLSPRMDMTDNGLFFMYPISNSALYHVDPLLNIRKVNLKESKFISIDSNGKLISLCHKMGDEILLLDANTLKKKANFNVVQRDGTRACYSSSFNDKRKELWIGSPTSREVVGYDISKFYKIKEIMKIAPVSGPFKVISKGNYVFTINGLIGSAPNSLPLVINTKSGKAVIGHLMGEVDPGRMIREFGKNINVDRDANYFRTTANEIIHFDPNNPVLENFSKTETSILNPYHMVSYGSCRLVAGHDGYQVAFELFKNGNSIAIFDKLDIKYFFEIKVDKQGRVYFSNRQGIFLLKNAFTGYNC